jgi:hypothetical protein
MITAADEPAEDLAPWERKRRLRGADLEAANEHGQQLVARYGRTDSRPTFANLGHMGGKRRRR